MNVVTKLPKETKVAFFQEHWGGCEMIVSTGIYYCPDLPSLAVISDEGQLQGLLTYKKRKHAWEIVSLDALIENQGIGSLLLRTLEEMAQKEGIKRVELITTNDNIRAIEFYQKRGYRLEKVIKDAVSEARKKKPTIPLVANNGIVIQDEWLFVKNIV
jgi:GNAT superfamily N-acetyltransferase